MKNTVALLAGLAEIGRKLLGRDVGSFVIRRKLNLRNFLPLLNIFKIFLASILMGIFLFFLYPFIKEVIVFHSENLNQIINFYVANFL